MGVSVSMEDSPSFESRLSEHLGLDLSVQLTGATFNVELVRSSACCSTHHEVSSVILETWDFGRGVRELQVPGLLLFLALFILRKAGEEVFAFLHLSVSVGVDDSRQILHETEVGTHCVCQTGELTELWDESDFISSLPVLVDEERLVGVSDVLVVSGLVVLSIAYLGALFVESGRGTHSEVDSFHPIRLLVVSCDNSAA